MEHNQRLEVMRREYLNERQELSIRLVNAIQNQEVRTESVTDTSSQHSNHQPQHQSDTVNHSVPGSAQSTVTAHGPTAMQSGLQVLPFLNSDGSVQHVHLHPQQLSVSSMQQFQLIQQQQAMMAQQKVAAAPIPQQVNAAIQAQAAMQQPQVTTTAQQTMPVSQQSVVQQVIPQQPAKVLPQQVLPQQAVHPQATRHQYAQQPLPQAQVVQRYHQPPQQQTQQRPAVQPAANPQAQPVQQVAMSSAPPQQIQQSSKITAPTAAQALPQQHFAIHQQQIRTSDSGSSVPAQATYYIAPSPSWVQGAGSSAAGPSSGSTSSDSSSGQWSQMQAPLQMAFMAGPQLIPQPGTPATGTGQQANRGPYHQYPIAGSQLVLVPQNFTAFPPQGAMISHHNLHQQPQQQVIGQSSVPSGSSTSTTTSLTPATGNPVTTPSPIPHNAQQNLQTVQVQPQQPVHRQQPASTSTPPVLTAQPMAQPVAAALAGQQQVFVPISMPPTDMVQSSTASRPSQSPQPAVTQPNGSAANGSQQ